MDTKEMMTELLGEIDHTDPEMMKVPSAPEKGDQPVATLEKDDWLRKLFVLSLFYAKQYEELRLEHHYDEENAELKQRISKYKDTTDALTALFWLFVRDKYKLWSQGSIAIRKGFNIVLCKNDDDGPPEFIKRLLNLD